ncbi:MAG: hypothetical protein QOK27_953 [Gemmatimonadales bacterium]|nr:hypothetical protein [Gemmatimonadales bacterium]
MARGVVEDGFEARPFYQGSRVLVLGGNNGAAAFEDATLARSADDIEHMGEQRTASVRGEELPATKPQAFAGGQDQGPHREWPRPASPEGVQGGVWTHRDLPRTLERSLQRPAGDHGRQMTPVPGGGVNVAVHLDAGCCLGRYPGDDIRLAVAADQAIGTPE